jgi:hypothetical protein
VSTAFKTAQGIIVVVIRLDVLLKQSRIPLVGPVDWPSLRSRPTKAQAAGRSESQRRLKAGIGATRKPLGEHGENPPFDWNEHGGTLAVRGGCLSLTIFLAAG